MRITKLTRLAVLLLAFAIPALQAGATTVMQQNLNQMTQQAEKIFRGEIISVREVSVNMGGGTLKGLEYRVRVDEVFKGNIPAAKGGVRFETFRVIGSIAGYKSNRTTFLGLPNIRQGKDYLLMMGPVSYTGLTNTIGLANGCFEVYSQNKQELAVNGNNNLRLFENMNTNLKSGAPVAYADLASLIRAAR